MAKRSRGSTRPGQRRPARRPVQQRPPTARPTAPTAATARPSTALTPEEEARAAELEARLVADERAAEEARVRSRGRTGADTAARGRTRDGSPLANRAAEEYTYLVRDIRRIVAVGGGLIGIMLVLWLVLEVLNVF